MINMDNDYVHTKEQTGFVEPVDVSIDWEHFGLTEMPNTPLV
jgi:hypothetical protein